MPTAGDHITSDHDVAPDPSRSLAVGRETHKQKTPSHDQSQLPLPFPGSLFGANFSAGSSVGWLGYLIRLDLAKWGNGAVAKISKILIQQ